MREHFVLDPEVTFLNHGSFGACPRVVLDKQSALRGQMERQPVRFFMRDAGPLLDDARDALAAFVGAEPAGVAFVRNATYAVNAVLRSLELSAGDELLTTNQAYGACANALDFVAARAGARVVRVPLPFPLSDEDQLIQPILDAVTPKTKLALLDHIFSPTGLVLPIESLVEPLEARGVRVLIDGAHAPGQVHLDLAALGASYYTGNLHKWLFAPKGCAFLHVREDRRDEVRPLAISHGATAESERFHREFDWTGTDDPSPWLSVPEAIKFGASLPGGWAALMKRNHALALEGRRELIEALEIDAPCPDHLVGSLAAIPVADSAGAAATGALSIDPLQDALMSGFGIEVPVFPWPAHPTRLLRVSAQIYNALDEYARLAQALLKIGGAPKRASKVSKS